MVQDIRTGKEEAPVVEANVPIHEVSSATNQDDELREEDMEALRQKLGSMIGKEDCLKKGPAKPS